MKEVFYDMSQFPSLILALFFGIVAVLAWVFLFKKRKKHKKARVIILAICIVFVIAIIVNIFYMMPYEKVPYVIHLNSAQATNALEGLGFIALPSGEQSSAVSDDGKVVEQNPAQGVILKKGSFVILTLAFENLNEHSSDMPSSNGTISEHASDISSDIQTPDSTPHLPLPPQSPENLSPPTSPQEDLSIAVDSYEIFTNGFLYEAPAPDNWIIQFDKGISGTFHYSRTLTTLEAENWMHGGTLLDVNMNEIAEAGNYPSFWSDMNGFFAMEFPVGLPAGTYIYRIHQVISDAFIYSDIVFEYTG